jgi:hypothetical protein
MGGLPCVNASSEGKGEVGNNIKFVFLVAGYNTMTSSVSSLLLCVS